MNDKQDKAVILFGLAILFIFIAGLIYALATHNAKNIKYFVFGILFWFLPWITEKGFKLKLAKEFWIILWIWDLLAMFLGEALDFYNIFPWWDIFLHAGSGFIIAPIGFIYLCSRFGKNILKYPGVIFVFTLCFGVAVGTFWEYLEFIIDLVFKSSMQKGLFDTMTDLLYDTIGALFFAVVFYLYAKGKKFHIIERWIRR